MPTVPQLNDRVFFREMDEPVMHVASVTPSDSDNFAQFTRAIYVGGAGDIHYYTSAGDDETTQAVLAGSILPLRVYRILSTGTTATKIQAWF